MRAAAEAKRKGIIVNVVGITGNERLHGAVAAEIEEIAAAGGGLSRIVSTKDLPDTVQMLTRQAASQTIQHAVETILQKRSGGTGALTELPPEARGSIVQWMESVEAASALHLLVLVDTSASMRSKLPAVKKSLEDLHIHLRSRKSLFRLSLYTFPGTDISRPLSRQLSWTADIDQLQHWLHRVRVSGITPTGPALQAAANEFESVSGLSDHAV